MAFYTERHGLRKSVSPTLLVTVDMYELLFDKCKHYFDNISWKYPDECSDGYVCSGLDERKLLLELKFLIPDLFGVSDADNTHWKYYPGKDIFVEEPYNQYSLFDFIEFMYSNIRDITAREWHGFMQHSHLKFSNKRSTCDRFIEDINGAFLITGLQYELSADGKVERIISDAELAEETMQSIKGLNEQGLVDLLTEAVNLYKAPRTMYRSQAVEKIWDAFERMKTFYSPKLDKKSSANQVISTIAGSNSDVESLLHSEFMSLTSVGNDYRIRHHEKGKVEINDDNHYDYLFSRCLALINLAVKYLR